MAVAASLPAGPGDGNVVALPDGRWVPAYKLVAQAEIAHLREPRSLPNDPLFPQQWHLSNNGAGGGTAGIDLNVTNWWDWSATNRLGAGVVIGVVDSGVEYTHPDLAANYLSALSWDHLSGDPDPFPTGGAFHGTAVAGLAAARGHNALGVVGVAPLAGFAALRLTAPTFQTDAMEAATLTHQNNNQGGLGTIHVYCNPWGPSDSRPTLAGPGPLTRAALRAGTVQGRNGLGSVILWASGNGRGALDNANYDGYANSHHVIAVGACDNRGQATPYAEPGTCLFVCAPSEGGPGTNSQITTTDRTGALGRNTDPVNGDYFNSFGGTSAAVGLAAGVAALVLEANPGLGWRDVKHIFALTSTRVSSTNAGWTTNAAGYAHHDTFGFGLLNAAAAGALAQTWNNVSAEVELTTGPIGVNQPILDGTGLALTNPVFGPAVTSAVTVPFPLVIETVSVTFQATHTYRGDVEVVLTSPTGVESVLAGIRNDSGDHYTNWVFTTVKNWGEFAAGTWTLRVRDGITNDSGAWQSWSLTFHGTPVAVPPLIRHLDSAGPGLWQVTFDAQSGVRYQVFHSSGLAPPVWSAVGASAVATAASCVVTVPAPPGPQGFFTVAPVH